MFKLPKNHFKILNPNQYICTIVDDSELYIEVDIQSGKGYHLTDEIRKKGEERKFSITKPSTLLVDAIFMPVKQVNYKIKMIHEFSIVEGLREDILEVLLNLKEVVFNTSFVIKEEIANNLKTGRSLNIRGFLQVKGPVIVTAGMFKLPKNHFKILNPNQYICTIVDDSELYIEVDIQSGKGYHLTDEIRKKGEERKF